MKEPDIEAIITCQRNTPFFDGYRPTHLIQEDYLTSGTHKYYDRDSVEFEESVLGVITFITPKAYPHCLWEGKKIIIQEGSKVVGYAVVVKIFNEFLRTRN